MRFPPSLLDEIRARVPVSQVVGRKVPLKRAGREMRGLSPFKTERTPSFFVNDHKGFYHCFATGEHGDIFTFLMKIEGLSFPEAVERLAAEAGVAMPKPTERDHHREDERARLLAVCEAACAFFESRLRTADGTEARRYLEKRGLARDTIERFRIGFAASGRSDLKAHLGGLGFSVEEQILAGMLVAGDDIPVPYDRFRNRVIFPIADAKGRIIAFGGRALEANVPAKYLNSPETPLFHKGNVLFNLSRARQPAHEKDQVLVVEGYMDVVALDQAGFPNAVAPLGTALTEAQIQLLWRMSPEPTLCFDGDSAGRKAAYRAVDVALAMLEPGQSLGFAFLPDGFDPDDLVRQQGPEAMGAVLSRIRPLSDVLWEREWAAGDWSTPERRARLEQNIRQLVQKIANPAIRQHYVSEMQSKLSAAWGASMDRKVASSGGSAGYARRGEGGSGRPWNGGRNRPHASGPGSQRTMGGGQGSGPGRRGGPQQFGATATLRSSSMVAGTSVVPPYREALLLKTLINHPWLIEERAEEIAALEMTSAAMIRLRDAILSMAGGDFPLDTASLRSQLTTLGSDKVVTLAERAITHRSDKFAEPDAERSEVESGWLHTLALHVKHVGLRRAVAAAELAWQSDATDEAWSRIVELRRALDAVSSVDAGVESSDLVPKLR